MRRRTHMKLCSILLAVLAQTTLAHGEAISRCWDWQTPEMCCKTDNQNSCWRNATMFQQCCPNLGCWVDLKERRKLIRKYSFCCGRADFRQMLCFKDFPSPRHSGYHDARCCFKTANPAWAAASAILSSEQQRTPRVAFTPKTHRAASSPRAMPAPWTLHARGAIQTGDSWFPFSFNFKHPGGANMRVDDFACTLLYTLWRVYAVQWVVFDWAFAPCLAAPSSIERLKVTHMRTLKNDDVFTHNHRIGGTTPHGKIRLSVIHVERSWRFPLTSTLDWFQCSTWSTVHYVNLIPRAAKPTGARLHGRDDTLCSIVSGANEAECRARAKMYVDGVPPDVLDAPVAIVSAEEMERTADDVLRVAVVIPSEPLEDGGDSENVRNDSCARVAWLRDHVADVERVRADILERGLGHLEIADHSDGVPMTIMFDLRSPKFRVGAIPAMIDPPHLDTVPFFMYPMPQWLDHCRGFVGATHVFGPDVYLTQMWQNHPWRVLKPEEADLFVIPGYFGLSAEGLCGNHHENMNETFGELKYFNASQRDHLVVGQHFKIKEVRVMGRLESYMPYLVQATHVRVDYRTRTTVPIPYGDVLDMYEDGERTCDIAFRNRIFSVFFMGRVDGRVYYIARNKALLWLGKYFKDAALITSAEGRFPECPDAPELTATAFSHGCYMKESRHKYMSILRQSRFGLMIGGDTPDSSRIYDYISCGILPVIISPKYREVAMPFARDICWESFATFIEPQTFHDYPIESIIEATNITDTEVDRRLAALERARQFLDYTARGTLLPHLLLRDVAMTSLGKRLTPMDSCPNRGATIDFR